MKRWTHHCARCGNPRHFLARRKDLEGGRDAFDRLLSRIGLKGVGG